MDSIGDRIQRRRKACDLSQADLGKAVGVSSAAVSQWENGQTKGLKPINLIATAKSLRCDVEWLVTGKESNKAETRHYLEPGVLHDVIEQIEMLWGGLPEDNQYLAGLIADGYARTMLSARDAGRVAIRETLEKAFIEDKGRHKARRINEGTRKEGST